ncbi:MAG: hypothetical protein MHPSP_000819, partial [Paramarteilia canceri]
FKGFTTNFEYLINEKEKFFSSEAELIPGYKWNLDKSGLGKRRQIPLAAFPELLYENIPVAKLMNFSKVETADIDFIPFLDANKFAKLK